MQMIELIAKHQEIISLLNRIESTEDAIELSRDRIKGNPSSYHFCIVEYHENEICRLTSRRYELVHEYGELKKRMETMALPSFSADECTLPF